LGLVVLTVLFVKKKSFLAGTTFLCFLPSLFNSIQFNSIQRKKPLSHISFHLKQTNKQTMSQLANNSGVVTPPSPQGTLNRKAHLIPYIPRRQREAAANNAATTSTTNNPMQGTTQLSSSPPSASSGTTATTQRPNVTDGTTDSDKENPSKNNANASNISTSTSTIDSTKIGPQEGIPIRLLETQTKVRLLSLYEYVKNIPDCF
jgi:hypothetical protein